MDSKGSHAVKATSPEDIIEWISGWEVECNMSNLTHPKPHWVEMAFWECVKRTMHIDESQFQEPIEGALTSCGTDEEQRGVYAATLTRSLKMHHICRLARAACLDDFTTRDITHPEPRRLITILGGFINFFKFIDEVCLNYVKDLYDNSEAAIVDRDKASDELNELERKVNQLKAKIAQNEPRCEELRVENSALFSKMIATKELQTASVSEIKGLKEEKNALLDRKEALNAEITSISETINRTRSRIVQSPERIKRTISVMSTTALEDKRTVTMQEAKARDLQAKISALSTIEQDIRGCVEQLQTIEKEVRSLRISQKELADVKDHLDDKNIENQELKLRAERVAKQLSNAHEKLEKAQKHAEEKKFASRRTIERLQREYDEMVAERRDNDKQVEELRAEATELEKKMAEHLRESEMDLNDLLTEYWAIRHGSEVYMETLANKLNMRVTAE